MTTPAPVADATKRADNPMPCVAIFLWWADMAQAAGDRARAQLYIECAFAAIDREEHAQVIRPARAGRGTRPA
jgi:hypothetical protein